MGLISAYWEQRSSGLQAGGLDSGGKVGVAPVHSGAGSGWEWASPCRVSVCGSQWHEWEQEVLSAAGQAPGSGTESVGGGDGESVPGSEAGAPAVPPGCPPSSCTFFFSSFRSTFSARRSFSSRCTLPCSASKSRSRTAFWDKPELKRRRWNAKTLKLNWIFK